jgi:hypothetical protein
VLEKRKQRIAALDSEIERMQNANPGRKPDWSEEKIMNMDRAALELGKRCIMWDDRGTGFFLVRTIFAYTTRLYTLLLSIYIYRKYNLQVYFLIISTKILQMLNWDWVRNRPASPPTPEAVFEQGWWVNAKELLTLPLVDPSIPETKLAAWLDTHTMNVHSRLLEKLDKVRLAREENKEKSSSVFILEDQYWEQLQSLPRENVEK